MPRHSRNRLTPSVKFGLSVVSIYLIAFTTIAYSDGPSKCCSVWIKPQMGHPVFGIPPAPPEVMTRVSDTSRVDIHVDGKLIGTLKLGDVYPQIEFKLTPGIHNTEFVADITANGKDSYSGHCPGVLQIIAGQSLVVRPWFDFSPDSTAPGRHMLTTCELIPWQNGMAEGQ